MKRTSEPPHWERVARSTKRAEPRRSVACGKQCGVADMRIFLAGATGAIGPQLVPLLLDAVYSVIGTTRSTAKADGLRIAGAEPVVVDVFDAAALSAAVLQARPDVVIHQLTDLPPGLDPKQMTAGTQRNARVRSEGTQNL